MYDNGPRLIKNMSGNLTEDIAVNAGSVAYSIAFCLIDLDSFALGYKAACTGSPNVKVEIEQSFDNSTFFSPDTFASINDSLTNKNQHGAQIAPITAPYMRIKITELSGVVTDTVITTQVAAQKRFTV